jgi:hypothetical protein
MSYPYFYATLGGSVLVLLVAASTRSYRRSILLSGQFALTLAPWVWTYEQVYWKPNRLFSWPVGIEDFLCAFTVGGLSWAIAFILVRRTISFDFRLAPLARRFIPVYVILTGAYVVGLTIGLQPLTADLLLQTASTVFVLIGRPFLWRMAVAGFLGFAVIYTGLLLLELAIWPEFLQTWSPHSPWFRLAGGVPVAEILWSGIFGATWPLVMAYAAAAKRMPAAAATTDVLVSNGASQ